jgi:hypothetical protein
MESRPLSHPLATDRIRSDRREASPTRPSTFGTGRRVRQRERSARRPIVGRRASVGPELALHSRRSPPATRTASQPALDRGPFRRLNASE